MSKTSFDLQRIELLVRGDEVPKDIGEEVFLIGYKQGLGGALFMETLLQIADVMDEIKIGEAHMFMLGYAMGQKDLEDAEEDMTETLKPKSTVH